MKCSWCYEQSARQITSWITTQKPRLLKAQRLCDVSTITPRVKTAEYIMSMFTQHDTWHQSLRRWPRVQAWRNVTLGWRSPFGLIPRVQHLWQLCFCQICLNMKHCVLFTFKDGSKVMSVQEALLCSSNVLQYKNQEVSVLQEKCYFMSSISGHIRATELYHCKLITR